MNNQFAHRLYLVVSEDACQGRDIVWVVEEAVKGGVDIVQLREKCKAPAAFTVIAARLKGMLDTYNVPLIINDNLNVAMSCKASGIHVGNSDMPPGAIRNAWPGCGLLGYSIEYEWQLFGEQAGYADYLGISPVFKTATKTNTVTQWGIEGVAKIRSLTGKPLVAIGNMNAGNTYDVIKAGADCIAVVSAICGAENPARAAACLKNEIEKAL